MSIFRFKPEFGITLQTHISVPSIFSVSAIFPSHRTEAHLQAAPSALIDWPNPLKSLVQRIDSEVCGMKIMQTGKGSAGSDSLYDPEPPVHSRRNFPAVDPVNDTVSPAICASVNKGKTKMTEDEVEALCLEREALKNNSEMRERLNWRPCGSKPTKT